jgi:hypothetical protein
MSQSDKPLYRVGILVQFTENSPTRKGYALPIGGRFEKNETGYIISVSDQKKIPDYDEAVMPEYLYTIRVGRGMSKEDIGGVPESLIENPNADISSLVENRLRKAQEKKEFKDSENRIGGSKKEKIAYKMIKLSDLEAIENDEALAIELIQKDKVFPKFNFEKEMSEGVSSGTAFLKNKLRASISSKPAKDKLKRQLYIGLIDYMYNKLQGVYTLSNFRSFREDMMQNAVKEYMKIIDPEKISQIEQRNDELQIEIDENQVKSTELEAGNSNFRKSMSDKYGGYGWESKATEEEKQTAIGLLDALRYYREQFYDLRKQKVNPVVDFIKQVSGGFNLYSDSVYSLSSWLYNEVFGAEFRNFITKNEESSATELLYKKSEDLEALSEEESKSLIESFTNSSRATIERKKRQLEELSKIDFMSDLDAFMQENASHSNYRGSFGGYYVSKHTPYNGCNTPQMKQWFKDGFIYFAKQTISEQEKEIAKYEHKYRERKENWEWAFEKKSPLAKKKSELKINTYPPLSYIKRTGGIKILDEDVTVDSIKTKFGFKEVEFGISLKDSESKEHVRHFLGAMADLADVLNYDIVQLNQFGGLSIAFASRGSGKASAAYYSLRKVINITKTKGGGAVAHEYMHYIDNIIPKIHRAEYTFEDFASAPTESYHRKIYKIHDNQVANRLRDIFNYIERRELPTKPQPTELVRIKKVIPASSLGYSLPDSMRDRNKGLQVAPTDIETYIRLYRDSHSRFKYIENLGKKDFILLGEIVNRFGYKEYEFEFMTVQTAYLAKSRNMGSIYWVREWELLARAFETYIYDKLDKAGRANNYLVSGAYFDDERGVYPQGEEREILFALYDALMATIKQAYSIGDFKAWTTERTDEYVALDEKDEDTLEGITVDDETGEVLEEVSLGESPKKDKFAEKLVKLYDLLIKSKEQMEEGGEISCDTNYSEQLKSFLLNL